MLDKTNLSNAVNLAIINVAIAFETHGLPVNQIHREIVIFTFGMLVNVASKSNL